MIPVHVRTPGAPLPDGAVYYVVAAEGVFLARRNHLFESVTKVDRVAGLESQAPVLNLYFQKVPRALLERVYGFFQFVHQRWEGEAVVLLYYSPELGFAVEVPPQKLFRYQTLFGWRTEGRVEYGQVARPPGYVKLGDIHSHADMPAYFSMTDDRDDAEDGLRIVIGSVNRSFPDVRASFVTGGYRFKLDAEDVLEDFSVPLPPPAEWTRRITCRYENLRSRTPQGDYRGKW